MKGAIHRRLAGMVMLTMLVTAGTLVASATSASADPIGCTVTNGGNFAQSQCIGGTGEHRVIMRQRHFDPSVGDFACVGPWVQALLISRTACGPHTVVSVTVETRPNIGPPTTGGPMEDTTQLPQPDRIPVPIPPGMNPPVPVRCFSQLFQSLIVRTRDNAPAYVFVVEVTTCNNTSGSFQAVPVFTSFVVASDPLLEEIRVIDAKPPRQSRINSTAIQLEAQVVFFVCLDPVNNARCITYLHSFNGIVNDRRQAAGNFSFGEVI